MAFVVVVVVVVKQKRCNKTKYNKAKGLSVTLLLLMFWKSDNHMGSNKEKYYTNIIEH